MFKLKQDKQNVKFVYQIKNKNLSKPSVIIIYVWNVIKNYYKINKINSVLYVSKIIG